MPGSGLPIRITSPSPNEVLTYPLAIIRGTTTSTQNSIFVSTPFHSPSTAFPISNHAFTALYLLSPGSNHVRISLSPDLSHPVTIQISLNLRPLTPPYVRLIYLLTSDSDGAFQSPYPAPYAFDITSGTARLQTAGLLIQSAAAEMMHAQNLGRRTFRMAPQVLVERLPITNEQAHNKTGEDLFRTIAEHLYTIPHRNDIIDLVVMSFTRMTPSGVKAHTALGGGFLALFGGASLFTWPTDICQIPKCLLDTEKFDDSKFFDDSNSRMQYMGRRACTATTIGVLLHELGHCFSLLHSYAGTERNKSSIMNRGFDNFDRLFVQSNEQKPCWDRSDAMRLRYHRFFQFGGEPQWLRTSSLSFSLNAQPSPTPRPQPRKIGSERSPPRFKRDNGGVICLSEVGIGHICYSLDDRNAAHEEFEQPPKEFRIPGLEELRDRCLAERLEDKLVISVIDIEGRIVQKAYEDVE